MFEPQFNDLYIVLFVFYKYLVCVLLIDNTTYNLLDKHIIKIYISYFKELEKYCICVPNQT